MVQGIVNSDTLPSAIRHGGFSLYDSIAGRFVHKQGSRGVENRPHVMIEITPSKLSYRCRALLNFLCSTPFLIILLVSAFHQTIQPFQDGHKWNSWRSCSRIGCHAGHNLTGLQRYQSPARRIFGHRHHYCRVHCRHLDRNLQHSSLCLVWSVPHAHVLVHK